MSQDRLTHSLCSKLPVQVQEIAMGTSVANSNNGADVVQVQAITEGMSEANSDANDPFWYSFLQNNLRKDEFRKYVCDERYDKIFNLTRLKKARTQKPRPKKTALSLKERQELGLCRPNRKAMKYTDFLPLHELWKSYFSSYLDIEGLESHGFTPEPDNKHWDDVTRLLLKADYHGCILTVKKSRCSSLVGKSGIIVFDTKNTFKLLGEDNVLRTIPKPGTVFCFKMEGYTFTVLGSHFCIRPSDRSSKKIKSLMNPDL
ncbi:ribonuclease P protein subunit p29 [Anabrus simplex]|uniref:ribonuclease P protein subunit p29 n=1 Tax=Anabrus simplex TaxID=316456 RepID=UPI0035A35C3A